MKANRSNRTLALLLPLLLAGTILLFPAGCFRGAVPPERSTPSLLWPPPPEVPRVHFVNAFSRPEELGISEGTLRRFFRYLAGRPVPPMVNPNGVAVGGSGKIFVVDHFLRKVHVFDPGGNDYAAFPKEDGLLLSPVGIAVDRKRGKVFVSDSAAGAVKVFTLDRFAQDGEIRGGEMGRPTGIAVHEGNDELLVLDTVHSGILRFSLADRRLKGIVGKEGGNDGGFHSPTHIAVSPGGEILVTDALNYRVQLFSSDGRFLRSFGEAGDGPGFFSRPKGVAADSDGNIYVVDALFGNVQVFDRKGRLLMAFGSPGQGPGEFWLPTGIFIDGQDRIYVADSYNRRVQIFQYMKEGELPK